MPEDNNNRDVEIAAAQWWQTLGLALIATGFVILGFTYNVASLSVAEATGVMSIQHNVTTNATAEYLINKISETAAGQEIVFILCALLAIVVGAGFLYKSGNRLAKLKDESNAQIQKTQKNE